MACRSEIYVCELCGNSIEVLEGADGMLTCCGQDMTLQTANSTDAAQEKHVPQVSINGTTASIQVGSTLHPMEPQHFITWIELQQEDHVQRIYLTPSKAPKAEFVIQADLPITVRAHCNLHGLWKQ